MAHRRKAIRQWIEGRAQTIATAEGWTFIPNGTPWQADGGVEQINVTTIEDTIERASLGNLLEHVTAFGVRLLAESFDDVDDMAEVVEADMGEPALSLAEGFVLTDVTYEEDVTTDQRATVATLRYEAIWTAPTDNPS